MVESREHERLAFDTFDVEGSRDVKKGKARVKVFVWEKSVQGLTSSGGWI